MKVNIPYGTSGINFELPDKNVWQVLFPYLEKPVADLEAEIKNSLESPIGTASLGQILKEKGDPRELKIAIICDDITHPTPQQDILNALVPFLQQHRVMLSNVRIIVATGTHRQLTREELFNRFGRWMAPIAIENHSVNENLIKVGSSHLGGDIFLNRDAVETDVKIAIGSTMPHPIAGFGGGSRIIVPGIAGLETIQNYHKLFIQGPPVTCGQAGNFMRSFSDRAAKLMGLDFIINVVQNATDGVCGVFSGNYSKAFLEAASFARKILGVRIKANPDLVIGGSYPADLNFWEALKSFLTIARVARDGGAVLLITPCVEGISRTHPGLTEYVGIPPDELKKMIKSGKVKDISAAAVAVKVSAELQRINMGLISSGITRQEAETMKIVKFNKIKPALAHYRKKFGEEMKVSIIPYGGKVLPYFDGEKKAVSGFTTRWMSLE